MSSHKRKNTKSPGSEFECGLTIPKFLQPYKDMLGNDSVFRNQIRQERENAFADKEAEQLGFNDNDKQDDEKKEREDVETSCMSEKDIRMMKSALSNKNIDSIREMTKKLISSSSSSKESNPPSKTKQQSSKEENGGNEVEKSNDIKKKTNGTTFGSRKIGQKRMCNPMSGINSPPIKSQKRGMLTFSEDSDSDCL